MALIADGVAIDIKAALDLRHQRQQLLTSNLANVDTPHYTPEDLAFEGALQRARAGQEGGPRVARTDDGHLDSAVAGGGDEIVERPDLTNSLDGNGVDLDAELARATDNALRYSATIELARRRHGIKAYVINRMGG